MKDSPYGIVVWFIVTLFVIYAFCLNTASAVFNEAIKHSLHTTDMGVSIAMGAFIIGFAGAQIPAGFLLDRFNPKWVVSMGVLLLAVGNMVISFADSVFIFSLSNFLQGIGGSFAFIAAGVLISQWFSDKKFPVMFGLTQTLSCILSGIAHYVMMVRLNVQTWNSLYQYLAIYGAILFALTLIFVRSPRGSHPSQPISLITSLRSIVRNRQIMLCAFAAATSFGVLLGYASFWYLSVQKYYAVSNTDAFVIGGIIFAGMGIGTPIMGWLSNVVKSRRTILHCSLVLGTMVLLADIYLPRFDMESLILVKIISFLTGFLLSGSMLFYTVVSELASNATRGVALSVTNTAVFLFNTCMLFIPHLFITKQSTLFFSALWIFPFCLLISILTLYFIKETYNSAG